MARVQLRNTTLGHETTRRHNARRKEIAMTTLLERAFAEASKLPAAEQELLAARLLTELAAEDDFDRAIAATTDQLSRLAAEALAEHRAGLTQKLDPDQL
jgi:hypothetical protein